MNDRIFIQGLEVFARIGITPEERAKPQRLKLDAEIEPLNAFAELEEQIGRTVDYYQVSLRLDELALSQEWQLIETLAHKSADLIVTAFPAIAATVTVRKFILPQTEFVAVRTRVENPRAHRTVPN